ncbi:MAG: right-handed parallel beta-helix repeat-containing protein [Planctomycetota bacterium]
MNDRIALLVWFVFLSVASASDEVVVDAVDELVAAVQNQPAGTRIRIAAGTYRLGAPLEPKTGMTIVGSGEGATVLTHVESWQPSTDSLPDPEVKLQGLDSRAYLIRIQDKAEAVEIANLTLTGPNLHGAIFSKSGRRMHWHDLTIQDFRWCGIRTFGLAESRITKNEFIDAGGKWKRGGIPGHDGGISGGAVFAAWSTDVEIADNRVSRTAKEDRSRAHYGIKGRGGKRVRIRRNTIDVNFSIEFPFENADQFEIDHNVLHGVVSIPKHAGGKVPSSGVTYDIHHNYFTTSYAIEFVRNGVTIHHNLFDLDVEKDGGNLISGFGRAAADGPAEFHNNLVRHPGRGVIWINEPYNHLIVRNNHIQTRTTSTPRREGLFGLNRKSDFSTIEIVDNIIECQGLSRPLLRVEESYAATIRNNRLINVSDAAQFDNPMTDAPVGLESELSFRCGVDGELSVQRWSVEVN